MYDFYLIRLNQIGIRNRKTYEFSIHKSIYDVKNITMEDSIIRRVVYDKQAIEHIAINESQAGEITISNVSGDKEMLHEVFAKLRYDITY